MKIIHEPTLELFRGIQRCEICKAVCTTDPHHALSRGHGGGFRLDLRINLIAVGASLPYPVCPCHADAQAYRIPKKQIVRIIANREDVAPDDLEDVIWWITRADKHWSRDQLAGRLEDLGVGARKLARRELEFAGILTGSTSVG